MPSFLFAIPFPSLPFSAPSDASLEPRVAADPFMSTTGNVRSANDALIQLSVDVSRSLLYTLSEKGDVGAFELGGDGKAWRVSHLTQNAIVQQALSVVKTLDSALFRPVVSVQAVDASESSDVHMVAITSNGVRLYYSTVKMQLQPPQLMQDMTQLGGVTDASMVAPMPVYPQTPSKPHTLCLLHIRMPPGFAANSTSHWPTRVHSALYRKGQLVMINSPGPERDLLWCLSSDDIPTPVQRTGGTVNPSGGQRMVRSEVTSVLPLDGFVLAVEEVVEEEEVEAEPVVEEEERDMELVLQKMVRKQLKGKTPDGVWALDPPPAVEQHLHQPRKYAVLTNKGIHLINKLRPVDVLHRLLVDAKGPDSQGLRTFFSAAPDQAGATCLLIACQGAAYNTQVAEWASRAFFIYGGEPSTGPQAGRPQLPSNFSSSPPFRGSPIIGGFNPGGVSTPVHPVTGSYQQPLALMSPIGSQSFAGEPGMGSLLYSHKHNALYILLGRLLRPIWNLKMVHRVDLPASPLKGLVSGILADEINSCLEHLCGLLSFITQNKQLISSKAPRSPSPTPSLSTFTINEDQGQMIDMRKLGENMESLIQKESRHRMKLNAHVMELHSLEALHILLCLCCEVLGLWKVLCLHQLHGVVSKLPVDQQNTLCQMTFRDFVLNGQDLCSILIENLINSYLGDCASVDAISSKLRDVCPSLYRQEDAACSKANEVLLSAISQTDKGKRDQMLQRALELCEGVCPHIDLPSVCRRFAAAHFPHGVLKLCLTCASRLDPDGLANRFYDDGQLAEDVVGRQAYLARMECYKEVTFLLDQAYGGSSATCSPPPSPLSATIASTAMEQPSSSTGDVKKDAKWLLKASLDSDDTLLHVAIYDWMLQRDLHAELLHTTQLSSRQGQASVKNSLETYLRRASERDPDSLPIQDLLWKYYESISDHASAAKVLQGLANSSSAAITLAQRITYLARAVMCMRSDQVGCAPSLGVFLKQLEDELDVVRIQQKVLDALKGVRHTNQHKAEEAVRMLESKLVDIGVLFDTYAEPFGLWECQLAIIYCSGYQDPPLLENIWENVLDAELSNTSAASSPDNRMRLLLAKVTALGNECSLSPRCFPLAYLTRQLEIRCCRLKADPAIVSSELTSLGIPLPKLIEIYDKLISSNDRIWLAEGNELHPLEALVSLITSFTNNPCTVQLRERRAVVTRCQDVVASCLSELYSRPNTADLIEKFRDVQLRLNRLR